MENVKNKMVRNRLKWASHVERMGDKKTGKKPDARKMEEKDEDKMAVTKDSVVTDDRKPRGEQELIGGSTWQITV